MKRKMAILEKAMPEGKHDAEQTALHILFQRRATEVRAREDGKVRVCFIVSTGND